jgi:hypothetical protein
MTVLSGMRIVSIINTVSIRADAPGVWLGLVSSNGLSKLVQDDKDIKDKRDRNVVIVAVIKVKWVFLVILSSFLG